MAPKVSHCPVTTWTAQGRQKRAHSVEACSVSLLLNFANKTTLETVRIKEEGLSPPSPGRGCGEDGTIFPMRNSNDEVLVTERCCRRRGQGSEPAGLRPEGPLGLPEPFGALRARKAPGRRGARTHPRGNQGTGFSSTGTAKPERAKRPPGPGHPVS